MATRRSYSGVAPATAITTDLASGGTSFVVVNGAGYPAGVGGPFFVLVDRGLPSEEKILVASRSGNTFTIAASGRGQDGTIAAAHNAQATVEHTVTALDLDEANAHTSDVGGNPHPQYLASTGKAADSNLLDGFDSTAFVRFGQQASDSAKLGGIEFRVARFQVTLDASGNYLYDFAAFSSGNANPVVIAVIENLSSSSFNTAAGVRVIARTATSVLLQAIPPNEAASVANNVVTFNVLLAG